ncbi:hypothetical protein K503DRAFT_719209 [Rhizopogon vinicolor AM-OR11-026]|uniref:CLASP N-terminal domain-containing protein n=1 Tax=Rhizopogon vinicolor AM-OR11-026 TaxID=1314800 RepID=A0A1B7MYZ5_9AGAM|nr:hypothetical protein K503DRAFT_719209 [Rhizopogon vinicolor AM-OR11-026]
MVYRIVATPSDLRAEIEYIRRKISLPETEESCDKIQQGILQLTQLCNIGSCKFTTEMLAGIHSLSKPLKLAMKSEHTTLSSSAIQLVTALSAGLGPSFEPLVSLFAPTLLRLCVQTEKVSRRLAKACIFALIDNTLELRPSLLPYLGELDGSTALRLVAAEAILACLNSASFSVSNIAMDTRARLIEDVIELSAQNDRADVRKAAKDIFDAYKVPFPDRAASFISLFTPLTKKHVCVQGTTASRSTSVTSQEPSDCRPTTGRVNPVGRLLTSGIQTHPLNSKLPRDIPAVTPTDVSKQAQGTPSVPGPLFMQSRNPRGDRDIVRPLVSTTPFSQRVGNTVMQSHGKGPHVRQGTRAACIPTAHLPKTNGKTIENTRPPSVKPTSPGSPPKSGITKCDPKNNTTKIPSVCLTSAAAVRPSKAGYPVRRATSSRIPKIRTHVLPSAEVEVKMSWQKDAVASRSSMEAMGQRKPVLGAGPVTKGLKPVVKAPSCSTLCGMKNLRKPAPEGWPVTEGPELVVKAPSIHSKLCGMENPGKLASEDIPSPPDHTAMPLASSRVCESVASAKPHIRATTHDMLVPPNPDPNCPSHMGCRIRRASRQLHGRRSFITYSPRASLPLPLSPPEISAAEVIPHTQP